jgi:serine O-acetyltransferase
MTNNIFIQQIVKRQLQSTQKFPDKALAIQFINHLFGFLFIPSQTLNNEEQAIVDFIHLKQTLQELLQSIGYNQEESNNIVDDFFNSLPSIYDALLQDAAAVLQFDPAANSLEEVMVAYPGFFAISIYRFANQLHLKGATILPRLFAEYAHSTTGIDIHPGAAIGQSFFIDHGTGIVIGETAIIGNYVKIYQGVTLGALSVNKDLATKKRHPTIQDNVVIYAGATILGGNTIVGHDSVIGGNVWLTNSVLPNSIVYHKSDVVVRDKNPLPDLLNFVI